MNYNEYLDFLNSEVDKKNSHFRENLESKQRRIWLEEKVKPNGDFRDFYGDTTVISLNREDIKKMQSFQEELLEITSTSFAERIKPETFHITIHDLNNGNDKVLVDKKIVNSKPELVKAFKELKEDHLGKKLKFKSTGIFHSGNSICMCFEPKELEDFKTLMELDSRLEEVVALDRTLMPHVTLLYYNLEELNEDIKDKLEKFFEKNRNIDVEVVLDVDYYSYQSFKNMNSYKDELFLKDA